MIAAVARRAVLTAAAFAVVPPLPATAAINPVRDGMAAFSAGNVEQSISLFDEAIASKPASKPYLWQRGLSLYYADRFGDGAEQFSLDVSVNPNDTEETIWNFLCVARLEGFETARRQMLKVGFDRRPVMRTALDMFRGTEDEAALQAFAQSSNAGDSFYANLYLGLYREAQGDAVGAKRFIKEVQHSRDAIAVRATADRPGVRGFARRQAASSRYGRASGDYMASLAQVHVARRGW
jgi:tetratricopeptide (TPR) repeat protein